ncbi:glycosyltransferase [bacterium]|nr:glycosyltransferase [bacterium]
MITVGMDLEQFLDDPFGSGIQRVLQQLAEQWPDGDVRALFVIAQDEEFVVLNRDQAGTILSLPFTLSRAEVEERGLAAHVRDAFGSLDCSRHTGDELTEMLDVWCLPEVSYLPSVLDRFEYFAGHLPTVMIGFDTLPMTQAENYRIPPQAAADASRYFRVLARAGGILCISEFARLSIIERLRRNPDLPIAVADPGGDHLEPVAFSEMSRRPGPVRFLRLGSMEARKRPREIAAAFEVVRREGLDIELVFVGAPSTSDLGINDDISRAVASDPALRWVSDASDTDVRRFIDEADCFLSFGIEGFGIPVVEAIRRGTPVLFGGVQPAAEGLFGAGAVDLRGDDVDSIAEGIRRYSHAHQVQELTRSVQPLQVPTWRDFAVVLQDLIRQVAAQ